MRARSSDRGLGKAGRAAVRFLDRRLDLLAQDRSDHGQLVGGFGDERRALLEQAVGAFGARIERRARHGEHLAALSFAIRAVISEPERRAARQ